MARQVRLRNRQAAAVMQHEKLTGHAVQGGRHANQLVNERGAERHRGCTGSQPQDGTGARPSSVVSVESPPRAAASDVAATGTDRPSRRAGGVRRAGGGRAALGHPRVPAVPAATARLRPSRLCAPGMTTSFVGGRAAHRRRRRERHWAGATDLKLARDARARGQRPRLGARPSERRRSAIRRLGPCSCGRRRGPRSASRREGGGTQG